MTDSNLKFIQKRTHRGKEMEVRKAKCEWCEKNYAVMDSTSSNRSKYCSKECEVEYQKACEEFRRWLYELDDAWKKYKVEYVPGEDERYPFLRDTPVSYCPDNRRQYLAFKTRYQKWKSNHCWKNSFWAWDPNEDSGGSFFGGGGGGDGGGVGDLVMLVLKGIGILVAIWIGWSVIKGVWNGIFGGGGSEEITEAAIMEKWQDHLEKRRDAFEDGLPEKEIEAKGLKNYTWDEWHEKFRKENESADKPKVEKKELLGGGEDSAVKKAKEIGDQAMSAAKGLGDKAKELWRNVTAKEEKDPEEELKRLNARLAELEGRSNSGETTDVENIGEKYREHQQRNGIRIVVQGKGKTQDAAVRWAIRDAVWKTVGKWVDSKARIQENHDKVVAKVKTITEADVAKYELIDSQKLDGDYIVKVRVSVSKKRIAPKFAEIFPDVFGNVND